MATRMNSTRKTTSTLLGLVLRGDGGRRAMRQTSRETTQATNGNCRRFQEGSVETAAAGTRPANSVIISVNPPPSLSIELAGQVGCFSFPARAEAPVPDL